MQLKKVKKQLKTEKSKKKTIVFLIFNNTIKKQLCF